MTQQQIIDYVIKYGKATDTIKGRVCKSLLYLPYGMVRITIPAMQQDERHDAVIETLMRHQYEDFTLDGVGTNEKLQFYLFVKKEMERIQELERNFLSADPEPELVGAGVHKLNEFGAFATVHSLAKGDILKHSAIEALPYYQVYQTLKLNKVNNEIDKAYNRIINSTRNGK